MNNSEYIESLRDAIDDLMRELDHAYLGIASLPTNHPAKIACQRAAALVSNKVHT